jgi:hypothetical protein
LSSYQARFQTKLETLPKFIGDKYNTSGRRHGFAWRKKIAHAAVGYSKGEV